MKVAYQEEIDKLQVSLDATKLELETWYAKRYEDKDLVGEVKETHDTLVCRADQGINHFMGTVKSIRTALVSCFA